MVGETGEKTAPLDDTPKTPALPEDFYRALLELPACAVSGTCDDCGKCRY